MYNTYIIIYIIINIIKKLKLYLCIVQKKMKIYKTSYSTCTILTGGGHSISTTSQEDRSIIISKKKDATQLVNQTLMQLDATTGTKISRKTVARRLKIMKYMPEFLLCVSYSPDANVAPVGIGAVCQLVCWLVGGFGF